jgi:NAD(P)H-hydrate repair Nnr-like enzyme with NAD(P)H-hydrate dehydratase domain
VGARQADPSGKSHAGRSYVVFGKKDNTDAIELSAIAAGTGGFVINGESARVCQIQHTIYLSQYPQLNHLSRRH